MKCGIGKEVGATILSDEFIVKMLSISIQISILHTVRLFSSRAYFNEE
jgi:hypothetical protein